MPAFKTATSPAVSQVAITKSDTTVYDPPLKALWVGGAGDVAVVAADDTAAVTISGVNGGQIIPVSISKVMSTNTTATLMVGWR
jgi:hypothetical protein